MSHDGKYFGILCVGLGQKSRLSAYNFVTPLLGRITNARFADSMHDAANEIQQRGCKYDCLLIDLQPPKEFLTKPGQTLTLPVRDGVQMGESIALAALMQNPHAKCLVHLDGLCASAGHETFFGEHLRRLQYVGGDQMKWEEAFFSSELFTEFYELLDYTPPRVPAAAH